MNILFMRTLNALAHSQRLCQTHEHIRIKQQNTTHVHGG